MTSDHGYQRTVWKNWTGGVGRGAVWDNEGTGQECVLGEGAPRGLKLREQRESLVVALEALRHPKARHDQSATSLSLPV